MATSSSTAGNKPYVGDVARDLRLFIPPDSIVELRAIDVKRGKEMPHVEAGFFDTSHFGEMAKAALALTPFAKGVYFTLNPLNQELLARRCNRVDWAKTGELAKDKDVLQRRWLLIDADPVRDPLISATDSEKEAAFELAYRVRDELRRRGWPDPIVADSGNGAHLIYRVDLPVQDERRLEQLLQGLADQFDTDLAKIDRTVFNPSRICKVPGTLARKGDPTPDRPHRRACILEVPSQ